MSEPPPLQLLLEGIPAIIRLRVRLWVEEIGGKKP